MAPTNRASLANKGRGGRTRYIDDAAHVGFRDAQATGSGTVTYRNIRLSDSTEHSNGLVPQVLIKSRDEDHGVGPRTGVGMKSGTALTALALLT